MTSTQTARVAGFRAQLGLRGHRLTLQPDGPELPALLQPASDEKGEYQLSEETTVTDIASILREDLGSLAIIPGMILVGDASHYRVVQVEDHPVDVAVRCHCEAVRV